LAPWRILSISVTICDTRRTLGLGDFLQAAPERIFNTDAGPVSINDDGAFDDSGFHERVAP